MNLSYRRISPLLCSLLVAVLLAFIAAPASAAPKCEAANFVISAGKTYDQAARSGSASAFSAGMERYSDMRSLALFALGRYRGLLPKSREAEYFGLTKTFMGRFMLEHGKDLRVGTLQIIECANSGGNINVSARTSDGNKVAFRLGKSGSRFIVRDMRVGSVWLVQLMRSNFVDRIRSNGDSIDALFKYLKR